MQCSDFFQPYLDWTKQGTDYIVPFLIAGNRAEANRFVWYGEGYLTTLVSPTQLSGFASILYSDKIVPSQAGSPEQPFDINRSDFSNLTLTVPNGPIVFSRQDNGALIAQFSTLECNDNGLLICTSDFERSTFVMSLSQEIVFRHK